MIEIYTNNGYQTLVKKTNYTIKSTVSNRQPKAIGIKPMSIRESLLNKF